MQLSVLNLGALKAGWRSGCGALLALAPLLLSAQEITLHMDVRLVSVFVNVTDQNGAIAGGLTRDDFTLAEDGRPQQIAVFERQSELPLNLTLAIDTSGSVHKDIAEETGAARRFAQALLRSQDQMSLLQFATDVRELTPFTNKVSQIERGLGQLRGDWATSLYDAIVLASQKFGGKEGRKALVIVSDGDDTASHATYAQAVEQALRNEVMIYSLIDVPIEASAGRDLGGEHALIALAEETGGKSFYVREGGLDNAFARVGNDLRTQYLLGYYPKNQERGSAFHRLRVTIPRAAPGAFTIRHRTGYYTDPPAKPLVPSESGLSELARRIYLSGGMRVDTAEVVQQRGEMEAHILRVRESVAEIDSIGVQVKDLDAGLLDFPYRLEDQVVLLCWRMGEPAIAHWHPTDSGFKDRQLVDERFRRRSASGNRPN
ncbi:MAG: VWA domain-containing protein [Terracidiphilus sp.]